MPSTAGRGHREGRVLHVSRVRMGPDSPHAGQRANAKVVSKRAAVATQAIVVRADSPYNVPADLRGKTVAVNFHAGSHYITLVDAGRLDERQGRCAAVHVGGPKQRLRFLEEGKVEAAAVMEPWITVAAKRGSRSSRGVLRRRRSRDARSRSADVRRDHARDQQGGRQRSIGHPALPQVHDPRSAAGDRDADRRRFLPAPLSLCRAAAVHARGVSSTCRTG